MLSLPDSISIPRFFNALLTHPHPLSSPIEPSRVFVLMQSIRSSLARDGYAVIPNLFSAPELAAMKQQAKSLIANRPSREASVFSTRQQQKAPTKDDYFMSSGGDVRFFMEDSNPDAVNKIGHALHDKDDVFGPLCYSKKIRAVCTEIDGLETDPRIVQTMYILKGPKTGGEVSAHQVLRKGVNFAKCSF